jgi:hypothetical protein
MSWIGKSIEVESRPVVAEGCEEEWKGSRKWRLMGMRLCFGVMKTVLKLIIVMFAQLCGYNKNHESHRLDVRIEWYVKFISIRLFKSWKELAVLSYTYIFMLSTWSAFLHKMRVIYNNLLFCNFLLLTRRNIHMSSYREIFFYTAVLNFLEGCI